MTTLHRDAEDLLRTLAPQVLGVLVRRHGQFYACEDAVQEALLAAAVQWPERGLPEHPRSWLVTVATRRLTDEWRSERARRDREVAVAAREPAYAAVAPPADEEPPAEDDTLKLLFLCCHPALTVSAQVALTLRAVGGLSTAQIARAYLVPEATMSPADPPGQAAGRGGRRPVRPALAGRPRRAARCRAARALPGLQRGLHRPPPADRTCTAPS